MKSRARKRGGRSAGRGRRMPGRGMGKSEGGGRDREG